MAIRKNGRHVIAKKKNKREREREKKYGKRKRRRVYYLAQMRGSKVGQNVVSEINDFMENRKQMKCVDVPVFPRRFDRVIVHALKTLIPLVFRRRRIDIAIKLCPGNVKCIRVNIAPRGIRVCIFYASYRFLRKWNRFETTSGTCCVKNCL